MKIFLYCNFLIFSLNEMFRHPVFAFPLEIIFGNSFINVSFWLKYSDSDSIFTSVLLLYTEKKFVCVHIHHISYLSKCQFMTFWLLLRIYIPLEYNMLQYFDSFPRFFSQKKFLHSLSQYFNTLTNLFIHCFKAHQHLMVT